jgi:ribosomal protein L21E
MIKGKKQRAKGKIKLSSYFKKFDEGDKVAIVKEHAVRAAFPRRIVGKSGKVIGKRGTHVVVEIKEGKQVKKYIVHPVHLKKLEAKK